MGNFDVDMLRLRSILTSFLTGEQATDWMHKCTPVQIRLGIRQAGAKPSTYKEGIAGRWGLRPEIAARRGDVAVMNPTPETDSAGLGALLDEFS